MPDPLDNIDWSRVFKRLTAFALSRLGSRGTWADAEDLAAEAITRVFAPDYKAWDPAVEPDLLRHLGSVVNGLISNRSRKAREDLQGGKPGEDGPIPGQDAHRAVGGASWVDGKILAKEVLDRLATAVEPDKLVSKLFWLEVEGIAKPSEQAARLGRPIRDNQQRPPPAGREDRRDEGRAGEGDARCRGRLTTRATRPCSPRSRNRLRRTS